MKKLNKQAGFTLAELLIVVAIIAILVAIGIPAFSTAMERSRETVDLSNIRGAYAEFMAESMGGSITTQSYPVKFKQKTAGWVIDTSGFDGNVQGGKTTNVPGAGDGTVTFTYEGTNDKPTMECKLGSGGGTTTNPTTDPTTDPTTNPTTDPTTDPTTNPTTDPENP